MDMSNDLRFESHVAQKNRRHKLRFQQNTDHHQQQQQVDHSHDHFTYNSSHLFLPPSHGNYFVSHDNNQDSLPYTQDGNFWKPVVVSSQQQVVVNDHWNNNNGVSYSNMNNIGYHQDMHSFSSVAPFYQTTLQQDQRSLCLSLSSVPHLKDDQPMLQPGQNSLKSNILVNTDPKSLMGVSGFGHRSNISGPLGPFTGYATVLKNSRYIKPAQELLSRSCEVGYHELAQTCHDGFSQKVIEDEISRVSDCSSVGSYGESDDQHVGGGNKISGGEAFRAEFRRKKAKLLYMQEEVSRKYKQYLQQMQMVIASFETVAGLSAATPYVCLALKVVSRHFHHVKNVISEQLSQMRKTVGEGLCSSTTIIKAFDANATSSSGVKSGGVTAGFFAPQQPVWRPQRGLPERAIAVLKSWLFEHFLHPYPSDADKHMLATQTGLTRNQVSNWFINARVRIWKPMVEEIHALETKGLTDQTNSSHPQSDGQDPGWMEMSSLSNTQPPECSRNPSVNINSTVDEQHDHQLRDHQNNIQLSGMERLMNIMPYPRATFDAPGLGPVSLTLGLRQNGEHVQHLQQHFGSQLIHDFVG